MKPSVIFFVTISILLWIVAIYFGWLGDIYFFGKNIYGGMINGHKVTISTNAKTTTIKSGQYAFNLLSRINIPDNITTIESKAFKGNILTHITIGANVNLADNAIGGGFEYFYAFNNKNAGSYTRVSPNSLQWTSWYGDFAYSWIGTNIIITSYVGSGGEIEIPADIFGAPVTQIGKDAFYGAGLTAITLPNTITKIDNGAFSANRMTRVTIPNSVQNIGVDAFANNPITRVSLGANITIGSNNNNHGILGQATGFNSAYRTNNSSRAGIYTRPSATSTTWTRTAR